MSYFPAPLPQSDRTLHNFAAYKVALDLSALQTVNSTVLLFTTAPNFGNFYPTGVYFHSDTLASATIPTVGIGYTSNSTQATSTADFCAAQSIVVAYPNQFAPLTLSANSSTSARSAPPSTPIYLRRTGLAGSSVTTAPFTTPASIGGSVTVSVNSSNNYAPIATYAGSLAYVWASGFIYPDTYIVTALPTTTSMTIQLQALGSGSFGAAIPTNTGIVNPSGVTVVVSGIYSFGDVGMVP